MLGKNINSYYTHINANNVRVVEKRWKLLNKSGKAGDTGYYTMGHSRRDVSCVSCRFLNYRHNNSLQHSYIRDVLFDIRTRDWDD